MKPLIFQSVLGQLLTWITESRQAFFRKSAKWLSRNWPCGLRKTTRRPMHETFRYWSWTRLPHCCSRSWLQKRSAEQICEPQCFTPLPSSDYLIANGLDCHAAAHGPGYQTVCCSWTRLLPPFVEQSTTLRSKHSDNNTRAPPVQYPSAMI